MQAGPAPRSVSTRIVIPEALRAAVATRRRTRAPPGPSCRSCWRSAPSGRWCCWAAS
ncbi:MAG: hypothetical protein IPN17_32830 [Deltaproteobacteria bacterium]|nr:hypothetical protein [Deltaproteobacteria bacterium]